MVKSESDLGELVWARETPTSTEALAFLVIIDPDHDTRPKGSVLIQWERGDRVYLHKSLVREDTGRRGGRRRNSAPTVAKAKPKASKKQPTTKARRMTTGTARLEQASKPKPADEKKKQKEHSKRASVDRDAAEVPKKKKARTSTNESVVKAAAAAAAAKKAEETDGSESSDDSSTEESDSELNQSQLPAPEQKTGENLPSPGRKLKVLLSSDDDDADDDEEEDDDNAGISTPPARHPTDSMSSSAPSPTGLPVQMVLFPQGGDDADALPRRPLLDTSTNARRQHHHSRRRLHPEEAKEDMDDRVYELATHYFEQANKTRTTVGEILGQIEEQMGVLLSVERKTHIQRFLKQLAIQWRNGEGPV